MNKCTGADGKVVYTEGPCEQNQTVTTIRTPPPAPAADTGDSSAAAGGTAVLESSSDGVVGGASPCLEDSASEGTSDSSVVLIEKERAKK